MYAINFIIYNTTMEHPIKREVIRAKKTFVVNHSAKIIHHHHHHHDKKKFINIEIIISLAIYIFIDLF